MQIRPEAKMSMLVLVLGVIGVAVFLSAQAFCGEADTDQPVAPLAEEQQSDIPPVVAKIEDEVVTGEEFQQAMVTAMRMKAAQSGRDPNRQPDQPPEGFERDDAERVLESLIRSKAIYVLAQKDEISVSDEEVNEVLNETKARFPEEQFAQILEQRGMTEKDLKAKLREQLISQKFFEEKTKDVTVTEEEVEEAYEQLKEAGRMDKPESADVSHILVTAPRDGAEEDIAEAKKEIEAARKRVVEGKEDFGEVAKDVSEDPGSAEEGGLYEDVPRGSMVPEFEQRMFELPLGEVSEPFQTQYGWHILKVEDREEASTATYEEVKDDVRSALEERAKAQAFNEYLDTAVEELDIEILLPEKEEEDSVTIETPAPGGEQEEAEDDTELPDEPA
ncbi:MAG: peptidylprolyl isomerase [Candidatus Hydrogenedentota bacterium]